MNNTLEGISNRVTEAEGGEREKGPEIIFDETAEKFPNTGKEIVNQVQEAQRIPGRKNPRRNTPRHIVIKLTKIKDKDKILKATWQGWGWGRNDNTQGNSQQAIS